MRDYDMEYFLMHYGTPGMKRPHGLKYKTRGVRNVYANRKAQMRKRSGNDSSENNQQGQWKKWKMIKTTENKVSETNKDKNTNKPNYPKKTEWHPMPRLERKEPFNTEKYLRELKEKTERFFKPENKYKTNREKALERQKRLIKNVKANHLTRFGIRALPYNVDSKIQNPNKKIGKKTLIKRRQYAKSGGSINKNNR